MSDNAAGEAIKVALAAIVLGVFFGGIILGAIIVGLIALVSYLMTLFV